MMLIPSLKSKTKHKAIEKLPEAPTLFLPLATYKGKLTPIVNPGDHVKKYQLLGISEGIFSSKLHSPVSGNVVQVITFEGQDFLEIQNDFKATEISVPKPDIKNATPDQLLNQIKAAGIEGNGGAKFPTYLKYQSSSNIEFLIINAAECEPYLTADYALLRHKTDKIIATIRILQKLVQAKQAVIAIEKQHKELKKHIIESAEGFGINLKVKLLPNEYPQGGELQLIQSVTGKKIPKGSIPAHHGVIVSNIGTLYALHDAIFYNKPQVKRIVTISGEKANHIGNYEVAIGTPISHILEHTGHKWDTTTYTTILGGPMMGKAIKNPNLGINKGSGGILLIPNPKNNRYNCIQCGYCSDVCPQHLMPMEFARHNTNNNTVKLREYNLNDCIECGACAYICPSDVPLMASIFNGKQLLKKSVNA